MKLGRKHTEGFTLAELLLVVAIVMILAAMALPSLISAQNNLRIVELDNAAEAIANAAQTQMTANKVAGTWLALVEKTDESGVHVPVYPAAQNPPASAPAGDVFYMTADQARNAGIIPGLSVDETVRNGDYIIEFAKSTASVVSVFYTDGKTGFFGDSPSSTNAAQTYYESKGSRASDARKAASPMIGYYEGTPAEATDEVALANPIIWVDETSGLLMVQDPNMGNVLGTATTVRFSNETTKAAFVISGLSDGTTTFVVSTEDASESIALSGTEAAVIIKQVDRNGAPQGNVYSIDLNALSRKVAKSDNEPLKNVFSKCTSGNKVKVEAEVAANVSVPGKATAYIVWPEPVGKLTLLITNPYSKVVADTYGTQGFADSAKFTLPELNSTGQDVGVVHYEDVTEDTENTMRRVNTNTILSDILIQENPQSVFQSYIGRGVAASDVIDDPTFRLRAKVGSYNDHQYQVWEIWLKLSDSATGELTRIGYLSENKWVWAKFNQNGWRDYTGLADCFTWSDKDENPVDVATQGTESVETVSLNTKAYYEFAKQHPEYGLVTDDDTTRVYVRTAPKSSEVHAYFDELANTNSLASTYLSLGTDETASRRNAPASVAARAAFETEFGASSSDATWVVTRTATGGFSEANNYLKTGKNVRVYYSISPGVGFENIRNYPGGISDYLTGVRSTRMTNVSLWLYRGDSLDNLKAMPSALLHLYDNSQYYTCKRTGSECDFKLDTENDGLFYRVLSYYDKDGKTKTSIPDQYVPHFWMKDQAIATIAGKDMPNQEDEDFTYVFKNWTTKNVRKDVPSPLVCEPGKLVGDYDDALDSKGTTLVAVYDEISKPVDPPKPPDPPSPGEGEGFAYLEFDSQNRVTGYYGYLNDKKIEYLPTGSDSEIASVGYYVLTKPGAKMPGWSSDGFRLENAGTVSIGNASYQAYKVTRKEYWWSGITRTETFKMDDKSLTVTFNMNFAAAITLKKVDSEEWGDDEAWNVRHWTQFPGFLEIDNVQGKYLKDDFKQTHDLDLEGHQVAWRSEPFEGEYDGGKQLIRNFKLSIDDRSQAAAGLFWFTKDAEIKNVNMVDVFQAASPEEYTVKFNNGGVSVGLLVGKAEESDIEKCTVAGKVDKNGVPLSVYLRLPENGVHRIGGLVGYATSSKISNEDEGVGNNCSVRNISFVMLTELPQNSSGSEVAFGGLIGYAQKVEMKYKAEPDAYAVEHVSFQVQGKDSTNVPVYAGGLVGRLDAGKNGNTDFLPKLFDGAITDFNIITKIGGAPPNLFVGSLIGFSDFNVPPGQLSEAWVSNVVHNGLNVELLVGNGKHKSASPNNTPSAEPQSNAEDSNKLPAVPSTNEGASGSGNSRSDAVGSGETTVPNAPSSNEAAPDEAPETSTPEAETVPETDAGEQGGSV